MKRSVKYSLATVIALAMTIVSFAQQTTGTDNSYSPYSKFGIGTINRAGTAHSRTMGNVGTAMRDTRYINTLNPASVTARDSLAFMADFSVAGNNVFFRQGDIRSINNTFNISDFVLSFPIWRSSAFMVGINPYSSVGYDFSSSLNDDVIGTTGNITDAYTGSGSIYKVYVGAGATFWKRLSVGAEFDYYFGSLEKAETRTFSSSYYRSVYSGVQMVLRGVGAKFGLQYEQPFGVKDRAVIGVTYKIPTRIKGDSQDLSYAVQSEITDTLRNSTVILDQVRIPSEVSVGLSYRHADRLRAEIDYTYSDWTTSNMDNVKGLGTGKFSSSRSHSINAGVEYTPNRNDIRYYMRKVSYRVGAYYTQENFKYDGNTITSSGITFGMTFPVFRWYNGFTIGVDLGQRGSLKNNLVRERYIGFTASLNVFDIWFLKNRYE